MRGFLFALLLVSGCLSSGSVPSEVEMRSFKYGNIEITPLGHASVMVNGSRTLYFDPFVLPADPKKADAIFISHGHYDHCDPKQVARISGPNTLIFAPSTCASKLNGNVRTVSAGDSFSEAGLDIDVVPAYNPAKPYHPKGSGVGFVVSMDNVSIYQAGDTDLIPEMKGIKADVALLPIGGTYTMDVQAAAKAALAIKPKLVVPIHYNYVEGTKADPSELKRLLSNASIDVKY